MTLPDPIRNARLRMVLVVFALAVGLSACTGKPAAVVDDAAPPPRPIGGDRDAHGCLPAAGTDFVEPVGSTPARAVPAVAALSPSK